MKRLLLLLVIIVGFAVETGAVLKEKDLEQTLMILQAELEQYNNELTARTAARKARTKQLITQLLLTMKQADQNALMLYSQKQENVFNLTYACNEATKLHKDFNKRQIPFTTFLEKNARDLARYDSLVKRLDAIPTMMTTKYGQQRRDSCLALAKNIRAMLAEGDYQLRRNMHYYNQTQQRLSELNDYAQQRYRDIQQSIFINGSESYPTLLSNLGRRWSSIVEAVKQKYTIDANDQSQWSSMMVFGLFVAIAIYIFIAIVLNQLFFRFILPRRFKTEDFKKKQSAIIMATTTITFALIQGILLSKTSQNFVIMASNLLVEFAWLLAVILLSILLRVKSDQIRSAFSIYAPLIILGFIVIGFRIILIPSEVVNLLLPLVLLVVAVWQWWVIRKHNRNIPRSDIFYTYVSLVVFIASVGCSWGGYTLLAVQLLIWWIMQLTCILTITCVSRYLELYAKKKRLNEKPITQTWAYNFVEKVVMPVLSVCSIMLSIYWAAKVFNLNELCWKIFKYNFIDLENLQVSILKLAMVTTMWFVFRYITKTILALLRIHYEISDPTTAS